MQKLQQFQSIHLKKQTSKLSLQIQFSLINSNLFQQTIARSPKLSRSPTTKNSLSIKPFDATERSHLTDASTQILDDRVQRLQHQVDKQFAIIKKFKQVLNQRMTECQNSQLCRQKHMKQLTFKRKIQMQTLKRQVKLAIKCNIEQREYLSNRLQAEFDHNSNELIKAWKKMKKIWKSQLKTILEKFEGHQNQKNSKSKSNNTMQSFNESQSKTSLKLLEKQLQDHLVATQKQSLKMQLELSSMIQNLESEKKQLKSKFSTNLLQVLDQVHKMEKSIKAQVKKEHLEAEQNRQKLLLLLEENAQKIQNQQKNKKQKLTSRFKPPQIEYRHLKP